MLIRDALHYHSGNAGGQEKTCLRKWAWKIKIRAYFLIALAGKKGIIKGVLEEIKRLFKMED